MATTPVPASNHLQPTHISVTFKILMPDQLRKISFTSMSTPSLSPNRSVYTSSVTKSLRAPGL